MEEHLRYDKLNGDEIDQLSKGDLTKTHALAYTENTVMRLRMQLPRSMYLRGFVGGSFENSKWSKPRKGRIPENIPYHRVACPAGFLPVDAKRSFVPDVGEL